ncbi:porin [Corticibacter populi]|uniref:Porin n=1 Tax=Corticibacter populi TaxID=1550736 RepID=A0A3M6QVL7_9BURK|nr:porin [Corticibacter populi]RMX06542.1 porin [Corticibacter populi]
MKNRSLVSAIAVMALCGAHSAWAQSSVSIYGRVNTTAEHVKLSGSSAHNELRNNGSNLGFQGEEDLGSGLKAGFLFEMDIDSTSGAADGFGSQSEVWLGGGWGRVRLGNYGGQSFKTIVEEISLHNDNVGTSADWLFADIMPADHHIGYVSPEFGGLVLELGLSSKDDRLQQDGVKKNAYELIANYDVGDLSLAASYVDYDQADQVSLRALYSLGDFQFGGYWQRDKNGWVDDGGQRNNYRLVGIYNLGNSEFHLNVGHADKYKKVAGSAATQWTLAWNYNFSKRTKVYALYTELDNGRNAFYGEDAGVARAGQDLKAFAIGLRHYF